VTSPPFRYHAHVLAALERHGLRPMENTDPHAVYDLLKAIYTFEIRGMKARRKEAEEVLGPQPLDAYRRQLQRLKARYPVLQIPAHHWVDPSRRPQAGSPGQAGDG